MRNRGILSSGLGPHLALAVALGLAACSSDTKTAADASRMPDVPQSPDAPTSPDAMPGVVDAGVDAAQLLEVQPIVDAGTDVTGEAGIVCPVQPAIVPTATTPMQGGTAVASTANRPQLAAALADSDYTILKALANGGTMTSPPLPSPAGVDGGSAAPDAGTAVSYSLSDNWDPVANGIGDVSFFRPLFTVAADGSGTHTSINQAIVDAIPQVQCGRVYIRIKAGTYREKVVVPSKTTAATVTLYSTETDAAKTVIVSGIGGTGLTASATMTVNAKTGFQMKNLTVVNDYTEDPAAGTDQSAVALLNQADRAQFENVRILGNIAPLYLKSVDIFTASRSYFRDCYVEGDQNIIMGRGVAVFDHTEIKSIASRQPTGGVVAYPSTLLASHYGFLFISCNFTADTGASAVALGQQWWEGTNNSVIGKVIVRNSTLGGHIATAPWLPSANRTTTLKNPIGSTPITLFTSDDFYPTGTGPSPAEPYLGEYANSGPGAAP